MTTLMRDGVLRAPTGLKVKGQSYASLEAAATDLRGNLPRIKGEQHMLDCLTIFERTLPSAGYNYRTADIGSLDDCAGFTIPEKKVVVLREDIYDKLHDDHVFGRSTVVHELSHIVLQHHVTLHRGAVLGAHQFYEDSEWQAKALTAALMMSAEACRTATSPRNLAEMCGTSVEAATYRIKTLIRLKKLTSSHQLWEYGLE